MSLRNIKAVLFDIDDTLYDRAGAQSIALELIVKRFSAVFGKIEKSRLNEAWQESDRLSTIDFEANPPSEYRRDTRSKIFLGVLNIREDLVDAVTGVYLEEYPKINAPIEGAIDVVRNLSLRYKTGAVSNSLADVQYRKLETLGIRDYLSCIVLSDELGVLKPDPRIFAHAAALLRNYPGECLFVGDSFSSDVVGSKAAGMVSCWFNSKGKPVPAGAVRPDFEIHDLRQLEDILR
jgi:5'-nucleotidase